MNALKSTALPTGLNGRNAWALRRVWIPFLLLINTTVFSLRKGDYQLSPHNADEE